MPKVSKTDKAYIAGLIDGEGCICLSKTYRKTKTYPFFAIRYSLDITVANTKKEMINFVQKKYPAHIHLQTGQGWRNRAYIWKISGLKLKYFTKDILPYLVIKKRQAKLTLRYLNERIKHNKPKSGYLLPKEIKKRERFYQLLKKLNQKGTKLLTK